MDGKARLLGAILEMNMVIIKVIGACKDTWIGLEWNTSDYHRVVK